MVGRINALTLVLEFKSVCVVSVPDKVSIRGKAFVILLCETPDFLGELEVHLGHGVCLEEAHAVQIPGTSLWM